MTSSFVSLKLSLNLFVAPEVEPRFKSSSLELSLVFFVLKLEKRGGAPISTNKSIFCRGTRRHRRRRRRLCVLSVEHGGGSHLRRERLAPHAGVGYLKADVEGTHTDALRRRVRLRRILVPSPLLVGPGKEKTLDFNLGHHREVVAVQSTPAEPRSHPFLRPQMTPNRVDQLFVWVHLQPLGDFLPRRKVGPIRAHPGSLCPVALLRVERPFVLLLRQGSQLVYPLWDHV